MKFTYWSGNRLELEKQLKEREHYIEEFARGLGLDTDKMKVSYNYKNQSKVISINDTVERGTIKECKNGVVHIGLNDRQVRNKIMNVATVIGSVDECAADIEEDTICSYIVYYAVEKLLGDKLKDVDLELLIEMFIGSYIKLSNKRLFENIRVINDPYTYLGSSMREGDWMDLFDICNYYRISTGKSFEDSIREGHESQINSKLNKIITELEQYIEKYKDIIGGI